MSIAQPGNPEVDNEIRTAIVDAVNNLRNQARNLDTKTLHDIGSSLYDGLSVVEKYKGVRHNQDTAIVGGGRRRR